MRRLVLWCLLGMSACTPDEPPPVVNPLEQPLCPDLVIASREPQTQALSSDPRAAAEPVLVAFRKGQVHTAALSRQREGLVESLGGRVKYDWPSLDAMAVSLTPEAQARLAMDPDVLSISPDKEVRALGMPSLVPALLAAPSPSGSTSEYTASLRMTQANQVWDPDNTGVLKAGEPTGEGITVCVIDSGIDPRHPELQAAYAGGRDFIDGDNLPEDRDAEGKWGGGHGTHVAGTIAAQLGVPGRINPHDKTLSSGGMMGVAPGVRLLVARVLNTKGSGSVSNVIAAVKWCREQGAKIASLSLGSATASEVEQEAFAQAWDGGMLVLAASGNNGASAPPEEKIYPAGYPGVIAVGAVTHKGEHPEFSQGGAHLTDKDTNHLLFVAPGVDVYSTYIVGRATYSLLGAGATGFESAALEFAPFKAYEGVLLDCGLAKDLRSCAGSSCDGFVAYVDRGEINFSEKVRNVASQGARAVIVGNNKPEEDESLGFTLGAEADWPPVVAVPTTLVSTMKGLLGNKVNVAVEGADYSYSTGTSMATPHVAGVAALVWSVRPSLTNRQVGEYLKRTALALEGQKGKVPDDFYGFGLVQAKAAVEAVRADFPTP